MTLLPGRDLGSELRQASVFLGSVPRCAATLCFCSTSWAPPITPTAQPSHAVQSWPERTATFGKSMRDRPHAPTNPPQRHYALPDISRPPPDEPSVLPSSSWRLVPQLFHSLAPARRAREPYLSRNPPAPRWGLLFVPRSRSSRPLLCPSASHQTPPLPKETRRALPSASVAVARSHPSASGWSSLIVPAVRIYSSHALGHRPHLIRGPDFAWRPPSPTARGFGGGYLATVQAFWANSTPGPRLFVRPPSAPEASQSIKWRQYVAKS